MIKEKTLGEFRTDASYHPSYKSIITEINTATANLIDLIDSIPDYPDKDYSDGKRGNGDLKIHAMYERQALKSIAQRKAEEAATWAVKAATKE